MTDRTPTPAEAYYAANFLKDSRPSRPDPERDAFDDVLDDIPRLGLSRRALAKRGFDVQQNTLFYEDVALYPASVLDEAEDGFTGPDRAIARASLRPTYETAFYKWLRAAVTAGDYDSPADAGLRYLNHGERNALSAGSAEGGGFAVPGAFLAEVIRHRAQASVIRSLARVVPTASDRLTLPLAQVHETAPNVYSSGFVASWFDETSAPLFTDQNPAFEAFHISLKKARAGTKVSNDLADDAEALMAFLAASGGENLGLVEDQAFFTGSGIALEPHGILDQFTADTDDVQGTTTDTISNTDADAGSAPKLLDMMGKLPSQYRRGARWIMRSATETSIRKLVDGSGRFMWPHAGNGLMDHDVRMSDFMPGEGTDGNRVAIFGDLGAACIVADRPVVSLQVLRERYADTDHLAVLLKSRSGIGLVNQRAIRVGAV